jgi:hypothetical protein
MTRGVPAEPQAAGRRRESRRGRKGRYPGSAMFTLSIDVSDERM